LFIKKSSFSIPIYHIKALTFICKEEIVKKLHFNNSHEKPVYEFITFMIILNMLRRIL